VLRAAKTRAEGLAIERQIRTELAAGHNPNAKAPSFDDFAKDFLDVYAKTHNKPSEVGSKRTIIDQHLSPVFGWMKLDAISVEAIERFKAEQIARGYSAKSVNNHLTVLRKMLATAVEWSKLGSMPSVRWLKTAPPSFRFLDFAEADRLLEAARKHLEPTWGAMVILGLKSGLRLGELLSLRWDAVDLQAGRLTVRVATARGIEGTPKSNKHREVPLSAATVALLKRLDTRLLGRHVFAVDGRAPTKGEAKWPLWRACRLSGLDRIGWHVLRHTFASHLVMRGVQLRAVQELLGHATITMTMRYAHLSPEVGRSAVELLDDLDRDPIGIRSDPRRAKNTGES
jgi:integrase